MKFYLDVEKKAFRGKLGKADEKWLNEYKNNNILL
jgi:hypothetical protein